jgi:hypothetical protein
MENSHLSVSGSSTLGKDYRTCAFAAAAESETQDGTHSLRRIALSLYQRMSLAPKNKGHEGNPVSKLPFCDESHPAFGKKRYADRNIHKALMISDKKESIGQLAAG